MLDETERSLARGSVYALRVAERYEIDNDAVIPIGRPENDRGITYLPLAYPELPTEFAKLKDADDATVLAFVQKWGLPGYPQLRDRDWPDPRVSHRGRIVPWGDPIDWIRSHAGTVQLLLDVLDYERIAKGSGRSDVLMEGLVTVVRPSEESGALAGYEFMVGSETEPRFQMLLGGSPEEIVENILSTVTYPNLKYLGRTLVLEENGKRVWSTTFPCLLSAIYSLLADAAAGERAYIRCAACGTFFLQTDLRQRYCPKSNSSESLCALKARQTKLRSKKKEDKE